MVTVPRITNGSNRHFTASVECLAYGKDVGYELGR